MKRRSALALLLLISCSPQALAAARIVPRSDYAQGGFFPPYTWVNDHISGLEEFSEGFTMGGNQDIVISVAGSARLDMQLAPDGSQAMAFACPSMRPCLDGPADQVQSCKQDHKYWSCDIIYQGPVDVMCTRFVDKYIGVTITNWVLSNAIGAVVEEPITFLNTGVIGILNDASGVYDAVTTGLNVVRANCSYDGVSQEIQSAHAPDLYIMREKNKNDVTNAISLFEFPSNDFRYLSDQQIAQQSLSLGGVIQPVTLDPASVQAGQVAYRISGAPIRIWNMQKDCVPTQDAPYDCP